MSDLIRIKNIDQYTQEYVNGELVLTLKKTAAAVPLQTPVQNSTPVTTLYLSAKQLISLPELPDSLQTLWCHSNQLTSLPHNLPDSLKYLGCSNNQITSLPDNLPNTLEHLRCSTNQLTSLPENLPDSLKELYCSNNQLTLLPDLPNSLQAIVLHDNPLTENYPEIFNFNSLQVKELVAYVNKRNREMRADAQTQLTAIKQLIAKFEKATAT